MDLNKASSCTLKILWFLLWMTKGYVSQNAFVEMPVNTLGTIGENITLNCEITDPNYSLFWGNPDGVNVYQKGSGVLDGFEGQYDAEVIGNSYNLIVINPDQNDTGQYKCECATLSSSAFAEVILFDSDPALACTETTSNPDDDFGNMVEGQQITLTCLTTFYGLWGPIQSWTDSTGQTIQAVNVSSGDIAGYEYTVTVNRSDNGVVWMVDSYYSEPPDGVIRDDVVGPPVEYYSRDAPVPGWNENYNSTQIVVFYPVENINFDNLNDEYQPGDVITCEAEGNPSPSITWVDLNATVLANATLTIDDSMEGTQNYSCVATNVVRGVTYTETERITFTVTVPIVTTDETTAAPTTVTEATTQSTTTIGTATQSTTTSGITTTTVFDNTTDAEGGSDSGGGGDDTAAIVGGVVAGVVVVSAVAGVLLYQFWWKKR